MLRAPSFWRHGTHAIWPTLLSPLGVLTAAYTARRVSRPGWRAPVPVICCGNLTVGGAGKTTLALDLGQRLRARGTDAHFLLRGYGGAARDAHRVTMDDPVSLVGDEAKLLAKVAPTWTGGDRAASARAAIAVGAHALILDDGLQNPTLIKDLSLLVIDGATGFGNGRMLPAGPLREPIEAGAARCQAAVLIGEDRIGVTARLPPGLPVLRATLQPGPEIAALLGRHIIAFAGLALPDKFFDGLAQAGVDVVARHPFRDHHPYSGTELQALLAEAMRRRAMLVTTPKDAVRLPNDLRAAVQVVGVTLAWQDEADLDALLARVVLNPNGPLERT
jgi:tetraacyldisaccharide 4'-kinase